MMVQVSIDLEELPQKVSAHNIVHVYGASEILGAFTTKEILQHFDHDVILDLIGEEKINEFLHISSKQIKEIA